MYDNNTTIRFFCIRMDLACFCGLVNRIVADMRTRTVVNFNKDVIIIIICVMYGRQTSIENDVLCARAVVYHVCAMHNIEIICVPPFITSLIILL